MADSVLAELLRNRRAPPREFNLGIGPTGLGGADLDPVDLKLAAAIDGGNDDPEARQRFLTVPDHPIR